ncbi:MAG: hypothetical protein DRI65_00885 [Chloroflexota bacterium]|nr:MAG: hypothetical protein DRI65_00885 [Chloroflexota bacterium]
MADIKQVVLERNLNPYHSFFSSFFAGLAELGMINQGSINIVSKRAAEYLYSYLEAKEILPDLGAVPGDTPTEVAKNLILYINKILNLVGEYDFKDAEDGMAVLMIAGNTCRICPKGVGGAEVKGTLCPIPTLIENLVNRIAQKDLLELVTSGIEKEGSTCKAYFKVLN